MSPDLRKVHETPGELRFAHPHGGGWIFALVGAGSAALGWTALEGGGRWVAAVFGLLLVWAGVSSALYRLELVLDLTRRRYRYRRGHLPTPEQGEGGFDDIEAVVLKKELERKGSDRVEEWEIELVLQGWPRPLELAEMTDGDEARREAERLASRLGVPLRERTGY